MFYVALPWPALYSALSRIRGSARLTSLYGMMAEPIFSEILINKEFLIPKPRDTLQPALWKLQTKKKLASNSCHWSLSNHSKIAPYPWPCHPVGFSVRCLGYLDSLGLQTPSNPCSSNAKRFARKAYGVKEAASATRNATSLK